MGESSEFTAPCPAEIATGHRKFSIGLPRCCNSNEQRFPLTPEGAEVLSDRGFNIYIEKGAADTIHYTDNRYISHGAHIVSRQEALQCDIVIHLAPPEPSDIRMMRRGAVLLTMLHTESQTKEIVRTLLERGIISVALDLIRDESGHRPFADILSEIDGRAAMAIASSLLADAVTGKGILLGGVAGLMPCEVTVIGAGIAGMAAARSASGLGSIVRMFDSNVYRLRSAIRELGPQIIGSALHPSAVAKALTTADVVIVTDTDQMHPIGSNVVAGMKAGVITFDLSEREGATFPSLPTVNLSKARPCDNNADGNRVCYIHAGSAVPRTAAMALSNTLITMLGDLVTLEGVTNALKLSPGMQCAVFTFLGKLTNSRVASAIGMRHMDIKLILQFS
ncbi:MAG: hypothetical protein K2M07_03530 [Muribaculaceae bacterium]|nr:hypothetical protein [Muribaculaceae bacterium]